MTHIYENVVEEFVKRNCTLLTTKEEHNELIKQFTFTLSWVQPPAGANFNINVFQILILNTS